MIDIDPQIIIQILNSEVAVLGIIMGIIALVAKIIVPKVLPSIKKMIAKHQQPNNDNGMPESFGALKVFIRAGDLVKETKGRILKDGSIEADGKKWVIEEIKPYLLTKGRNSKPVVFLDASKQIEYRFKDIIKNDNNDNNDSNQEDIAGQATDPHLLKQFSDSIVIQKLAAARPDRSMMLMIFLLGMFALMVIQQIIPGTGGAP